MESTIFMRCIKPRNGSKEDSIKYGPFDYHEDTVHSFWSLHRRGLSLTQDMEENFKLLREHKHLLKCFLNITHGNRTLGVPISCKSFVRIDEKRSPPPAPTSYTWEILSQIYSDWLQQGIKQTHAVALTILSGLLLLGNDTQSNQKEIHRTFLRVTLHCRQPFPSLLVSYPFAAPKVEPIEIHPYEFHVRYFWGLLEPIVLLLDRASEWIVTRLAHGIVPTVEWCSPLAQSVVVGRRWLKYCTFSVAGKRTWKLSLSTQHSVFCL
jgi:hypothetical protein